MIIDCYTHLDYSEDEVFPQPTQQFDVFIQNRPPPSFQIEIVDRLAKSIMVYVTQHHNHEIYMPDELLNYIYELVNLKKFGSHKFEHANNIYYIKMEQFIQSDTFTAFLSEGSINYSIRNAILRGIDYTMSHFDIEHDTSIYKLTHGLKGDDLQKFKSNYEHNF